MIYVIIFILMLFSWGISFITEYIPKRTLSMIMFLIICILVIVSATRPDTSSDYDNYYLMFVGYDDPKYELTTEPTYLMISKFILSYGGSLGHLMWVYAFISIPLKLYIFRKLTSYDVFFTGLPVYLSFFYTLHDCEQIRIAAALSFIMLCFYMKVKGYLWQWIPFFIIAVLFHYSSAGLLITLLCPAMNKFGIKTKIALSLFVILGILIWITNINIIASIPIPALQAKLALYEMSIAQGDHPEQKAISPIVLIRLFILFYSLYFYDTIRNHVRGVNLIIINECIALFFWFSLRSMSVFAVRVSEMFEMTDFLLWGVLPFTVKPSWVGRVFAFLIALFFFVQGIIYNQFGYL